MAITRQQTDSYPILQQEVAAHHPAASVATILAILQRAELGDLVAQSELFSDMEERDAHLYAEMAKRRMAVAQLDWTLKPAASAGSREKKTVQALEQRIKDELDLETLLFDLTSAIGHGYSCVEIEWARASDGLWMPETFHARPQRWFTVDQATRRQIRLRDYSRDGAELQRWGWIVHQHSAKTGEPGTRGLFRVLALPYLFKNFATKNWLRFCELYGVPIRVLFTMESDPAKKAELIYALQSIGQNGAAVLTGGKANEDLQTVDAARGEGQGFQSLIDWCERSMSKAILGGTLTSQADGKTSTNALGRVHDDVRYQIRDHDARQLADTLTSQLIGAILQVNRLGLTQPVWRFDTQEPEDLTLYADALPKLAAIGLRIPESWARDKLKIPEPEGNEPVLAPSAPKPAPAPDNQPGQAGQEPQTAQASAALASQADDKDPTPVTVQADLLALEGSAQLKAMVDHIRTLTEQSETLEELRDNLLQAYGGFSHQELANIMALAFAAADLSGRYDVQEGS